MQWIKYQAQEKYYKKHLKEFVDEHPNSWILIEGGYLEPIKVTFYETKPELDKVTEEYHNTCGATFLTRQIPNINELERIIYEEKHYLEIFLKNLKEAEEEARKTHIDRIIND